MMNFKPIRNKISKYSYNSLTEQLFQILKEQESADAPQPFWHCLTLLKWTLEFAQGAYPPKEADRQVVYKLMHQLTELEMAHPTFNLSTNGKQINKLLTIASVQQFPYQQYAWKHSFATQLVLFHDLKHKYDIAGSFQRLTGMPLDLFIEILFIYWLTITQDGLTNFKFNYQVFTDVSEMVRKIYGKETLDSFLQLLTVSRENAKEIFASDKRMVKDYNLQVFDTSFFIRYPFLSFAGEIIIPHRDILNPTANYFIYDYMKNRDDNFPSEFGDRMEKYIGLGLKEAKLPFRSESDLRRDLGRDHKVVDFLIDDCVLMEAKAIELKPNIGVDPTDSILANEFRKNIVKAYANQMLTVAGALKAGTELFGVIVTYKDLFIGSSETVWNQFLREETEAIKTADQIALLPPANLFFIDLRAWDKIVQIIKKHKISLSQLLSEIRDADYADDPSQKKFVFDMHLDKYEVDTSDLSYLSEAFERIQIRDPD